jgi:hypothetical protein
LGDEKIDTWKNSPTVPYNVAFTVDGINITRAACDAPSKQCNDDITAVPAGVLTKFTSVITISSGVAPRCYLIGAGYLEVANPLSSGANTIYRTTDQEKTSIRLTNMTAGDWTAAGVSLKAVLTPSATGALLLGSTGARGYISLSASFNPNAAGSYKVFKAY